MNARDPHELSHKLFGERFKLTLEQSTKVDKDVEETFQSSIARLKELKDTKIVMSSGNFTPVEELIDHIQNTDWTQDEKNFALFLGGMKAALFGITESPRALLLATLVARLGI